MIEIRDLIFRYPGRGSEAPLAFGMRINEFSVAPGTSTALVGPSGSGKTTLLGLIAGTLRAESGSIRVGEQLISDYDDQRLGRFRLQYVGQVFQAFELLSYLTVAENVMLPWYIRSIGPKVKKGARAEKLLRTVGLESKLVSYPGELSQGEQQRVAVCRAMLNDPLLMLADEPTGNLDQENKQNVVDQLVDQARQSNSTLLMVTHDESLLASFDSVLDMRDIAGSVGEVRQ